MSNLLLITVDCLRADRVYDGQKGRFLDGCENIVDLGKRGLYLSNCFTPVTFTDPSIASIMSSQFPSSHGVVENGTVFSNDRLRTLSEVLRDNGYETSACVSVEHLSKAFNFSRGFDYYKNHHFYEDFDWFRRSISKRRIISPYRVLTEGLYELMDIRFLRWVSGDKCVSRYLHWLKRKRDPQKSFFSWIHFFDVHWNYRRQYNDEGYHLSTYDENVSKVDGYVGEVLEALEREGIMDETIIAITADHGENLYSHDYLEHGKSVYDEEIRVPCIVHSKDVIPRPTVLRGQYQTIDLAPTLLALLDVPVPRSFHGRPILLDGESASPEFERTYVFSQSRNGKYCIRDAEFKYIYDSTTGSRQLYNHQSDPLEKDDLSPERSDLARSYHERLSRFYSDFQREGGVEPSKDVLKMLEGLGYV